MTDATETSTTSEAEAWKQVAHLATEVSAMKVELERKAAAVRWYSTCTRIVSPQESELLSKFIKWYDGTEIPEQGA